MPKATKTPRPTRRQRALAREIADALFTNGVGQKGDRLVLVKEASCFSTRVLNAQDLGGLCPEAVADLIAGRLAGEGS